MTCAQRDLCIYAEIAGMPHLTRIRGWKFDYKQIKWFPTLDRLSRTIAFLELEWMVDRQRLRCAFSVLLTMMGVERASVVEPMEAPCVAMEAAPEAPS